ncbi:MAG: helix-turn-helix domain-containing protein [Akkermansiaceae bacterium]|nr:helix-turn-helix domain-containing protein [Akkermansiaceae bacterium]
MRHSRESRCLSKNKLADMAGLNQRAITYIETRRSSPSIRTLIVVVDALGIKLSDLFEAAENGDTKAL